MTTDSPGELPATPAQSAPRDNRVQYVIVLAVLCLVTLGRLFTSEFTSWDDEHVVAENPNLNPPTVSRVMQYWTLFGDRAPMNIYIPMTYTVWGGLAKIAWLEQPDPTGTRLNPYVFH